MKANSTADIIEEIRYKTWFSVLISVNPNLRGFGSWNSTLRNPPDIAMPYVQVCIREGIKP